jgi:Methionine synthase I, cobalamin-binding domain
MAHVAAEMEREGFAMPLLIGGATTSRVHTAVKIHPRYISGQTVYVTDASRAVGVVSKLLSPETQDSYVEEIRAEYRKVSEGHASPRRRSCACRWPRRAPAPSSRIGRPMIRRSRPSSARKCSRITTSHFGGYIDWTPFFQTWELKGRYPAILDDAKQGAAARLFGDAQAMLAKILSERWFRPKAVIGFWPAGGAGRHPPLRRRDAARGRGDLLHLAPAALQARRAAAGGAGGFRGARSRAARRDYIGAFVVTAGFEEQGSPSASPAPMTIIPPSW